MLRSIVLVTSMALALTAFVACDDGDGGNDGEGEGTYGGSCHHTADSFCQDYSGEAWVPSVVQMMCGAAGGSYSDGHCPEADQIGTCLFEGGAEEEYARAYYAPDIDADAAETECGLNGGEWL